MDAIEIIAGLFATLAVIKLIVVSINKKLWINGVSKKIYGNPRVSRIVMGLLAIVIFYFLLQSLSIVQIYAVVAFTAMIMGLGFMSFSKELNALIDSVVEKPLGVSMWIYIVIWLSLSIWVLVEIFCN